MKLARLLGLATSALALATTHSAVWAKEPSWTITYAPIGSIPTLSEWGMLILAALLAVAAVFSLRKKVGSKTLLSIAAVCALGLGSVMGNKMIGEAQAGACTTPSAMSSAGGGTITFNSCGGAVTNTTSVPLQIISITPTSATTSPPNTPTCVTNLIVPAGAACYISIGV